MFGELPHLLTDSSHWAFEAITDLVFAVPAYVLGRLSLRRHDRKVHGTPATTTEFAEFAEVARSMADEEAVAEAATYEDEERAKLCTEGCGRMTVLGVCNYCFNGRERA